jgi:hypothetical protein
MMYYKVSIKSNGALLIFDGCDGFVVS